MVRVRKYKLLSLYRHSLSHSAFIIHVPTQLPCLFPRPVYDEAPSVGENLETSFLTRFLVSSLLTSLKKTKAAEETLSI